MNTRKRAIKPEVDPGKISHIRPKEQDPFNIKKKDRTDEYPKYRPYGLDINREEIPTMHEIHNINIPNAKVKQPKVKPHRSEHVKKIDITSSQQREIKHETKETEIIRPKQREFPYHNNRFKGYDKRT